MRGKIADGREDGRMEENDHVVHRVDPERSGTGNWFSPKMAEKALKRAGVGLSDRRLRQLAATGKLEARKQDGAWQIAGYEITRMLETRRIDPEPDPATLPATELLGRLEALAIELGATRARAELTERSESTLADQLQRERERADRAEDEARQLRAQLYGTPEITPEPAPAHTAPDTPPASPQAAAAPPVGVPAPPPLDRLRGDS